jgi:uncharacterized protein YkwD
VPGRFPPPALLALPAIFAGFAPVGTATAAAQACPPGGTGRAAVVCEINAVRSDAGRPPVRSRPSLVDAALTHSDDMVERRYFAHETPEGDGPAERASEAGYMRHSAVWRIGEVLLWSRGETLTAARAVELWLESPSHKQVLLSRRYRDVGAGWVAGAPLGDPGLEPATTVTVVFGRRSETARARRRVAGAPAATP